MPEPFTIMALTAVGKWVCAHVGAASVSSSTALAVGAATTASVATAAVIGAALYIYHLSRRIVKKWFIERRETIEEKPEMVAFTKKMIQDGKHKVVQGIFDLEDEKLEDGRIIEYDNIDQDLDDDFNEGDGTIIWK